MGKREGLGAPGRLIRRAALPLIAAAIVAAAALSAFACQPDPTATPTPTPTAMPTPTPTAAPTPTPTAAPTRARTSQSGAICPEVSPYIKTPSGEAAHRLVETHLYALEEDRINLQPFQAMGGGLATMCDDILIVSPWGRIALIDNEGRVEYSEQNVPMNLAGLLSHPDSAAFRPDRFRVADILLKQRSEGVWELFATHHYFTGKCVLFRLSAATVERDEASYSVSASWRTLFDAEPCLPPADHAGDRAGGRILTDGPDHLLVVVGDHGRIQTRGYIAPQDPESHLGKLVRVDIETGEAEILALGLRNPQGFARDADGNLWETEHGPLGGDELNLLEAGANYGSPSVTFGVQYGRTINVEDKHKLGGHEGYARPAFAWVPSAPVSNLLVNDERWFPLWKDDLLIGSLGTNQTGRSLFRVRRDGTTIQYVERIPLGYRVRDLAPMLDGRIALLADGGSVYFLSRSYRRCDEESISRGDAHSVDCEALSTLLDANQSGALAEPAAPSLQRSAALATPARVEVNAADRRLTVSWSPVEGATSYKIAARFANGVEPFEWSEYEAAAPPYAITDSWAGMSGLQYEVRAASVNGERRSEWSLPVTAIAPELRPAPADAIDIETMEPYTVTDLIRINLLGQQPVTRRSPFVWSVCGADGSDCELLPIVRPRTYVYLVPEAARGKRMQVQADYDKDGVSYTAKTELGAVNAEGPEFPRPMLPPGCEMDRALGPDLLAKDAALSTHLHLLEAKSVQTEWDAASGGAIEPLCNDLLVVSPWGGITLVDPNRSVERLIGNVPMNLDGFLSHPDIETFRPDRFRVADILLKQRSEGVWELFATHHYFTGECALFRLSAATVERDGASYSVSPSWRTLFDAEPCLPPADHSGDQAGGRILTDGPDHLLVVVGDHGWIWTRETFAAQDPDSHLGKLVRVDIETGEAEILALGLRNPQGFARDADGNLWETERGPQGGDELNLLEAGANYGFPSVTYGVQHGGTVIARENESVGAHEGFAKPRFSWAPSIAISAVAVNDERWFPLWKDDLLIGSLGTNQNGRSLFRVRRDGTTIQYVERIPLGYRVRDLTLMPDGRIAVLAAGGRVHYLSRSSDGCDARMDEYLRQSGLPRPVHWVGCGAFAPEDGQTAPGPGTDASPSAETAPPSSAELYGANCASCHSLSVEEHGVGPHLVGLIGRPIGQVEGWSASDALRSLDGVWTPESLAQFLADPQAFAPGTTMGSQGLSADEAQAIADYVDGLPGG